MTTRACLLLAALILGACATTPEDPNAPRGCVVVDNSDGFGAQANMYLVGADDQSRTRIGDVAMGRTRSLCTSRVTMPGRYYVLVERPAVDSMDPALGQNQPRPVRSPVFVLAEGDTWTWNVRSGRVVCTEGTPGDC